MVPGDGHTDPSHLGYSMVSQAYAVALAELPSSMFQAGTSTRSSPEAPANPYDSVTHCFKQICASHSTRSSPSAFLHSNHTQIFIQLSKKIRSKLEISASPVIEISTYILCHQASFFHLFAHPASRAAQPHCLDSASQLHTFASSKIVEQDHYRE